MIVYQYDHAGIYQGPTQADESPLEPGVYLVPARCTETPPPEEVPENKRPRFNGIAWELVNRSQAEETVDPAEKLKQFLDANPDVANLVNR